MAMPVVGPSPGFEGEVQTMAWMIDPSAYAKP